MLLRQVRAHLTRYPGLVAALVLWQLVSVIASLYLPTLNAHIIDQGVSQGDTGYIWRTGGWMLGVSFVQVIGSIASAYVGARLSMFFGRDTRARLFGRVGAFSAREVNHFGAPTLITRSTNDVQQVQMVVLMGATLMVMAPLMMVGGIIMALRESVSLSWLIVVAVILLGIVVGLLVRNLVPGFRQVQRRLDTVNRILREHLSGVRVIRAFGREPYEQQRFEAASGELGDSLVRTGRLMMALFPSVFLVMNLSTTAVWWFGGHEVDNGGLAIGSLTAYMTYLMQILMSVMMATFMFMMIPRAAVAAERIGEVLDEELSVVPPAKPVTPAQPRGVVEFQDAGVTYPGAAQPVLSGVTLRAEPGQTVAIVGATGSGKTTLVSLVARLFDATAGAVLIDGVDVRELEPDLLWGHIGIVPQKSYLFTGTVASNLRYGDPEATDEQLWEALRIAQAEGFVRDLEGGLEAPVQQGGSNFSGGQRQRLAIARALVSDARVYLFDDSFSALDLRTERALRTALEPKVRESTVFVVAQRISTVQSADQIVVLEDGRVVGLGRHDDLLKTCPEYAEIVASQRMERAS
ncbi:ABC transporter ATP-binding protein [Calidifontibacter terrae]